MVDSLDELKSSRSVCGKEFLNFEMLDAKIASALNKINQNSQFKKKVSPRSRKPKKRTGFCEEDHHLRQLSTDWCSWYSIGHGTFIKKYRFPTIKSFKPWWREVWIRNFDYETFDARHGRNESGAVVKSRKGLIDVEGGKGICYQWKEKGQCSQGDRCNFRHETQYRAQKPEHTAATHSEPNVSRGRSESRKRNIRGKGNHVWEELVRDVGIRPSAISHQMKRVVKLETSVYVRIQWLIWVWLLFSSLLLGGAGWSPPSFGRGDVPCALWAGAVLFFRETAPHQSGRARQHDQKEEEAKPLHPEGGRGKPHHWKGKEGTTIQFNWTQLQLLLNMFLFWKKSRKEEETQHSHPKGEREGSTTKQERRTSHSPLSFGRWCVLSFFWWCCLPPLPLGGASFLCFLQVAQLFPFFRMKWNGIKLDSLLLWRFVRSSSPPHPWVAIVRFHPPSSVVVCHHFPLAAVHTPLRPVAGSPLLPLQSGVYPSSPFSGSSSPSPAAVAPPAVGSEHSPNDSPPRHRWRLLSPSSVVAMSLPCPLQWWFAALPLPLDAFRPSSFPFGSGSLSNPFGGRFCVIVFVLIRCAWICVSVFHFSVRGSCGLFYFQLDRSMFTNTTRKNQNTPLKKFESFKVSETWRGRSFCLKVAFLGCCWSQKKRFFKYLSFCFRQHYLCTVSTVPPESTVVSSRFHIFQLQLCCTVTDKAAAALLAQRSSLCVMKTRHGSGALWFVNQRRLVRRKYFVLWNW